MACITRGSEHTDGPICKKLSRDYRAACEMLNDLRARADRADFGLVDNDYPWKELKREFLTWAKQATRTDTVTDYATSLQLFEEYCPVKSVRQVTHQHVTCFRQWQLERGTAPSTINKNVQAILNMLNKAAEWQRIGSNSIVGLKRLPHDEPVKDRRPLTVDEVEDLFEYSPPDLLPVWHAFMTTGIRHCELVDMLFEDVDFERREVTVRRRTAKNHKARVVLLCDEVLDHIAELRRPAASPSRATRRRKRPSSWPISRGSTCLSRGATRRGRIDCLKIFTGRASGPGSRTAGTAGAWTSTAYESRTAR